MSTTYPNLNYTNFPDSLDDISLKSNISNSTDSALVQEIQTYISAGNFAKANKLLNDNPQLLEKQFSANDFNVLRDAIIALEKFYTTNIYPYIENKQTNWNNIVSQFNYVGMWKSTASYVKNNIVNYTVDTGTYMYLCTATPPVGTSPINSNYWKILTIKGERGISGDNMSFTGNWISTQAYVIGDVVVKDNAWYGCTQNNTNKEPGLNPNYWTLVLSAIPAAQIPIQPSQPTGQTSGDLWYKTW